MWVCYLHGDQRMIDSLLFHQVAVSTHLYDFAFLEASNDIRVSDG